MKTKKTPRKADYTKLQQKIYLWIIIIAAAAVASVLFLRVLARNNAGDWIVQFLQNSFHMRYEVALSLYQQAFRNNLGYIMLIVIAIFFVVLSRFLLSQLIKYFNEINSGIDMLIEDESKEISLSPEMAFMEQKLGKLKQTLEKREQEAKLAEQRKNDVVMYLAHDIKTPLTSVIGYLSLLAEAPDMPVELKAKYVHITLDKAYRLERLIDEFFEITRYNFQTIVLAKEDINLCYMLVQLTEEFYPQLAANGKQAVIHAAEDLTLYGDPDKLARVFNNILKNAVAYSPDNSVIDIKAEMLGDKVSIMFKNAGSIPKDKLSSIFDKFYRLDSARSSDTGGAGLGLAIAKEIVVLHEGQIHAASDSQQTIFTVELPAKGAIL